MWITRPAKVMMAAYITFQNTGSQPRKQPQADISPTNRHETWVQKVGVMIPGSNKETDGQPKVYLAVTTEAACIYDTKRKCACIITPDRLRILLQAYSTARQDGIHSSIQPPVKMKCHVKSWLLLNHCKT
eukprot:1161869-Pelagomonas_calceolata.AAC.3